MEELIKRFSNYLDECSIRVSTVSNYKSVFENADIDSFNKLNECIKDLKELISLSDEGLERKPTISTFYELLSMILNESPFPMDEQIDIIFYILNRVLKSGILEKTAIDATLFSKIVDTYPYKYTSKEEVQKLVQRLMAKEMIIKLSKDDSIEYKRQHEALEVLALCHNERIKKTVSSYRILRNHYFSKLPNLTNEDISLTISALKDLGIGIEQLVEISYRLNAKLHNPNPSKRESVAKRFNHYIKYDYSEKFFSEREKLLLQHLDKSPLEDEQVNALATMIAWLNYKYAARKSQTVINCFPYLDKNLLVSLEKSEYLDLIMYIIEENIKSGILEKTAVRKLDKQKLEDKEIDVIKRSPIVSVMNTFSSLFFMYMEPGQDGILFVDGNYNDKQVELIRKNHQDIKEHYLDKIKDGEELYTEEDVKIVIRALRGLDLPANVIKDIENTLRRKFIPSPLPKKEAPKAIEKVAFSLKPIIKNEDYRANQLALKTTILNYFDIDTKSAIKTLNEEEIAELVRLLKEYGIAKNDIDNYIWKIERFNENASPIDRYITLRRMAVKYLNPNIKTLISLLDEVVNLYDKSPKESYQQEVLELLPDLIIEVQTAKTIALAKGIGQLS